MGSRSWFARFLVPALSSSSLLVASFGGQAVAQPGAEEETIAAGERLVQLLDCNACHTPKVLTAEGPRPDPTRLLSGHPADERLPSVPEGLIGPHAWGGAFNQGLTAWFGPWGTSFGTNLTPDAETGIGEWTEDVFSEAVRAGAHVGGLRPVLPPMPVYSRLTDEELHAIFVYLRSIAPVANRVPDVLPPPDRDRGP